MDIHIGQAARSICTPLAIFALMVPSLLVRDLKAAEAMPVEEPPIINGSVYAERFALPVIRKTSPNGDLTICSPVESPLQKPRHSGYLRDGTDVRIYDGVRIVTIFSFKKAGDEVIGSGFMAVFDKATGHKKAHSFDEQGKLKKSDGPDWNYVHSLMANAVADCDGVLSEVKTIMAASKTGPVRSADGSTYDPRLIAGVASLIALEEPK
jgi:hypothetical protein